MDEEDLPEWEAIQCKVSNEEDSASAGNRSSAFQEFPLETPKSLTDLSSLQAAPMHNELHRFHVTHIEKKLTSHESQEFSFHENKLDIADTEQETYSNEKLQWTGSHNGIVHANGVQERKLAQGDSERPPKETTADDLTRSETHLNLTANTNIAINETEGGYLKACSSQEAVNSAVSYVTETNSTSEPKDLSSKELEEDKKAEQMGHQRSSYEVSDNKDRFFQ